MPDFVDADGLSSQEEEWRRGINLPAPGTVEFQSLPTVIQIAARFPLLRIDSPPPVLAGLFSDLILYLFYLYVCSTSVIAYVDLIHL